MTEELLVHTGINHLFTLHLLFPHLSIKDYSGLEAFHSIFRGGTNNCCQFVFLSAMNKAVQINESEHELQKIDGNTRKKIGKHVQETVMIYLLNCILNTQSLKSKKIFLQELGMACDKVAEDSLEINSWHPTWLKY